MAHANQTANTTWDLSDVPAVAATDLAAAMRVLIDNERGLVLLRGLSDGDLSLVQSELQRQFQSEPQRALAVFVRLRTMVEVFSARRLQEMMLDRGYALLAPAIAIAASLRLNANRGFNPQRFMLSLQEALAANLVAMPAPRAAFEAAAGARGLITAATALTTQRGVRGTRAPPTFCRPAPLTRIPPQSPSLLSCRVGRPSLPACVRSRVCRRGRRRATHHILS